MWPLPRHILEQPFQENKAGFLGLPSWNEAFVGAGPFKMLEWVEGSYAILSANAEYVLGRPKLDQIEVRFFQDRGALKAALLAGAVHVPMGRGINADDALQIRALLGSRTCWVTRYGTPTSGISHDPEILLDFRCRGGGVPAQVPGAR